MNYSKIYNTIINNAQTRALDKNQYVERHHIIPKCMGGTNDKSNIVKLTAREHYIVHQLLAKMYPNNLGLIFAAYSLSHGSNGDRINNRTYEWIRIQFVKNLQVFLKNNHPMKGKKHSDETKRKISIAHTGKILTEEHKTNIRNYNKSENNSNIGKKRTPETCQNISKAKKGKKMTDETKKKCSIRSVGSGNPNYGKRKYPEFIYNIIVKMKNTGNSYKIIQKYLLEMGHNITINSIKNLFFAYKDTIIYE